MHFDKYYRLNSAHVDGQNVQICVTTKHKTKVSQETPLSLDDSFGIG